MASQTEGDISLQIDVRPLDDNKHTKSMEEKPVTDSSTFEVTSVDDLDLSYSSDVSDTITSLTADTDALPQASNEEKLNRFPVAYPEFLVSTGRDWFKKPCFDRFWRHYAHSMSWCRKHMTYTSLHEQGSANRSNTHPHCSHQQFYFDGSFNFNPWGYWHPWGMYHAMGNNSQMYPKRGCRQGGRVGRGRGRHVSSHHPAEASSPSTKRKMQHISPHSQVHQTKKHRSEEGNDAEDSQEEYEMEITEEMMEFFAKSEQYRKERDQLKNSSQDEKHVDLVGAAGTRKAPSAEAPSERPGARRTAEMLQLYGTGAAMIHGMETALQMNFDRNMDIKQPPFWPNMPLRILFE